MLHQADIRHGQLSMQRCQTHSCSHSSRILAALLLVLLLVVLVLLLVVLVLVLALHVLLLLEACRLMWQGIEVTPTLLLLLLPGMQL
jgi:hypothetical protein